MTSETERIDRQEAKLVNATFGKWKADVSKAMLSDERLLASDYRIGMALLQHLSSDTWLIFPAHETLAALTHMKRGNVIKCLDRLRTAGWVRWTRGNRQKANEYEFNTDDLTQALARLKREEDERRRLRQKRNARRSDVHHSKLRNSPPMFTTVNVPMFTTVNPNNTSEHIPQTKRAAT